MFNKQKYVNDYIKEKYKSIKIRVRNDDKKVIAKLESVPNINKYILDLIREDIKKERVYHYINDEVKITFPLRHTMQDLVDKAEQADEDEDYGYYANLADAIEVEGKREVMRHQIPEWQWYTLARRYPV